MAINALTELKALLQRLVARIRERPGEATAITAALVVPTLVFWVCDDHMMKRGVGYDEQFFVWGGWCILKGLRPYVDFFEYKPPMVFITHALALAIMGTDGLAYRVFFSGFALFALTMLHVSLMTRRVHLVLSTTLISALAFAWANRFFHDEALGDAESIGLGYYLLGVAALLARAGRAKRWLTFLGGALLATAVVSKEPYVLAVLATWLTVFFLENGTGHWKENARRYAKLTVGGAAFVFLCLCVYMVPTGAMRRYLELVTQYTVVFGNPQTSYCVVLGIWRPGTWSQELSAQVSFIYRQFFNTPNIGYLTPFFVASAVFAWTRSKVLFAGGLATVLAALWAVTLTNCYWVHYYNMALSGMFFFFIIGIDSMTPYLRESNAVLRRFVSAAFVAIMVVFMYPRIKVELDGWPYVWPSRQEPIPGVFDFVARYSAPDDRIFTTGPPQLYMNVNRLNAVRESSFIDELLNYYPGNTDAERVQPMRDQLERNRPKIVILDPEHGNRKVRHVAALIQPFLEEHHYVRVGPYYYLRPD